MSADYQTGDRRPIAARGWKFSQTLAAWLAARHASPNSISIAGMIAGILAGVSFALTSQLSDWERLLWLAGAVCVQLRLLANMLDGMVAILSRKASPVGELYNEVPDRVSDSAVFIGLGLAVHSSALLGFGAALTAMFTAYARAVGTVAGGPPEFCGPMAKPQRMFLVTVTGLFLAASPAAWHHVGRFSVTVVVLALITAGAFLTAVRRVAKTGRALNSQP